MRMAAAVVAGGLGVFPLQVLMAAGGVPHPGWTPFVLADQGGIDLRNDRRDRIGGGQGRSPGATGGRFR
jgi:hypothetical protein